MPPTLETADGKPVDVTPVDPDEVNRRFAAAMNDDVADEQAPPRREPAPVEAEKPKARRGRPPKEEKSRTADKAAETPPVPPTPAVTAKRASTAEESFRLVGQCLLLVGKATEKVSGTKTDGFMANASVGFMADGYVVNANAAPLAEKLALVAAVEPQIAKWLDKAPSAKVTAWMGLASVASGLAFQAAANHKLIKPGVMGTTDPAKIIQANEEAIAAQQKADEDEAAEYERMAQEDDMAEKEYTDAV
jgi:hypothetical protein